MRQSEEMTCTITNPMQLVTGDINGVTGNTIRRMTILSMVIDALIPLGFILRLLGLRNCPFDTLSKQRDVDLGKF